MLSTDIFKRHLTFSKILLMAAIFSSGVHTRFRLVPESTTLVDPELTLNDHYAFCYITHVSFGAHH